MFNIKWGIFPGAVAFVLALIVSLLLGQAGFSSSLVRALLFAVIFFALGCGIRFLINSFIPELLSTDTKNDAVTNLLSMNEPGSQLNISLEDASNAALPDSDSGEIGNMSDLVSGAIKTQTRNKDIDQNPANSYTDEAGDFSVESDSPAAKNSGQEDFFMDFSSFMPDSSDDSFSLPNDDGILDKYEDPLPERRSTGNKPTKLEGDFNPKEIAAGIRTVLEKDKKG